MATDSHRMLSHLRRELNSNENASALSVQVGQIIYSVSGLHRKYQSRKEHTFQTTAPGRACPVDAFLVNGRAQLLVFVEDGLSDDIPDAPEWFAAPEWAERFGMRIPAALIPEAVLALVAATGPAGAQMRYRIDIGAAPSVFVYMFLPRFVRFDAHEDGCLDLVVQCSVFERDVALDAYVPMKAVRLRTGNAHGYGQDHSQST